MCVDRRYLHFFRDRKNTKSAINLYALEHKSVKKMAGSSWMGVEKGKLSQKDIYYLSLTDNFITQCEKRGFSICRWQNMNIDCWTWHIELFLRRIWIWSSKLQIIARRLRPIVVFFAKIYGQRKLNAWGRSLKCENECNSSSSTFLCISESHLPCAFSGKLRTMSCCYLLFWPLFTWIDPVTRLGNFTEHHCMKHLWLYIHCVPRAQVCEVSSRPYLFAFCLNIYHTMHFTRFRHCRNATFKRTKPDIMHCFIRI